MPGKIRTRRISGALGRLSLVALLVASQAGADAPETSPRPQLRGESASATTNLIRPKARPAPAKAALSPEAPVEALDLSLRPKARPAEVSRAVARRQAGSVCGIADIRGTQVAPITGRIAGCGVAAPVKVRSVAGVQLSTAATMDCNTAKALRRWVNEGVRPAVGTQGGGVRQLRVVAHYSCRTRNNRAGAKISEHGKGRAIDIAGIGLQDGSEMSLLRDWGRGEKGRALRKMWRAACGPFGTVLGPEADAFHKDHFHFDTAQYRSGSYCR
ncbi:extensin family protein [Shimia ponticola]|uniref:extensin-like domain-containing protein n=1 Tax=Shimia ponticola TaxID=2582893 RepID=UPI0011BEE7E1|nr:extensin family protein [Shimia ponticola]